MIVGAGCCIGLHNEIEYGFCSVKCFAAEHNILAVVVVDQFKDIAVFCNGRLLELVVVFVIVVSTFVLLLVMLVVVLFVFVFFILGSSLNCFRVFPFL